MDNILLSSYHRIISIDFSDVRYVTGGACCCICNNWVNTGGYSHVTGGGVGSDVNACFTLCKSYGGMNICKAHCSHGL